MIQEYFYFLGAKFLHPKCSDSTPKSVLQRGTPVEVKNWTNNPLWLGKGAR